MSLSVFSWFISSASPIIVDCLLPNLSWIISSCAWLFLSLSLDLWLLKEVTLAHHKKDIPFIICLLSSTSRRLSTIVYKFVLLLSSVRVPVLSLASQIGLMAMGLVSSQVSRSSLRTSVAHVEIYLHSKYAAFHALAFQPLVLFGHNWCWKMNA